MRLVPCCARSGTSTTSLCSSWRTTRATSLTVRSGRSPMQISTLVAPCSSRSSSALSTTSDRPRLPSASESASAPRCSASSRAWAESLTAAMESMSGEARRTCTTCSNKPRANSARSVGLKTSESLDLPRSNPLIGTSAQRLISGSAQMRSAHGRSVLVLLGFE